MEFNSNFVLNSEQGATAKVSADAETQNQISAIGIRKVARESGIDRKTIRLIATGGMVKSKKYEHLAKYLQTHLSPIV